jgi:hypothetical protein
MDHVHEHDRRTLGRRLEADPRRLEPAFARIFADAEELVAGAAREDEDEEQDGGQPVSGTAH